MIMMWYRKPFVFALNTIFMASEYRFSKIFLCLGFPAFFFFFLLIIHISVETVQQSSHMGSSKHHNLQACDAFSGDGSESKLQVSSDMI